MTGALSHAWAAAPDALDLDSKDAKAGPAIGAPLGASSLIVEGRVKLWPGVSLASRADILAFDDLAGSGGVASWEAPVRRIETAAAYQMLRNVTMKVGWQVNRRDGGRIRHDSLLAAQILYWF